MEKEGKGRKREKGRKKGNGESAKKVTVHHRHHAVILSRPIIFYPFPLSLSVSLPLPLSPSSSFSLRLFHQLVPSKSTEWEDKNEDRRKEVMRMTMLAGAVYKIVSFLSISLFLSLPSLDFSLTLFHFLYSLLQLFSHFCFTAGHISITTQVCIVKSFFFSCDPLLPHFPFFLFRSFFLSLSFFLSRSFFLFRSFFLSRSFFRSPLHSLSFCLIKLESS